MSESKLDPSRFVVDETTEVVDVDLDEEVVEYAGDRLTEARAESIAQETLAELRRRNLRPGGKSLSGGSRTSPVLQVRVSDELKDTLEREASDRGVGMSKLVRSILQDYVDHSTD